MINLWIGVVVQFHNVLHGFWGGWGTGTASLESKLFQQLMEMMDEVLYGVFLDLSKAYGALAVLQLFIKAIL